MNNILKTIGLTDNEVRVYTEYIRHPLRSAAETSRALKMDKSSTYKAVESLSNQGLLIQSGFNKAFTYIATNPETLYELYNTKKAEFEASKTSLDSFINKLKIESKESRKTYITYETGFENLHKRFIDSLESKEKLIRERWRYHSYLNQQEHVNFVLEYAEERAKRKIFMKQIEPVNDKISKQTAELKINTPRRRLRVIRENPNVFYKSIRYVPERMCDNNSFRIWDDYINILSFENNNSFILITIYDKFVAEMMKNMFDFILENSLDQIPTEITTAY